MKMVLSVVGVLALLMGVLWVAQGTGLFPYPRQSFMISQTPWIWRGALLAGLGALALWSARRRAR